MQWRPYSARKLAGASGFLLLAAIGVLSSLGGPMSASTWVGVALFGAGAVAWTWQAFSDSYWRQLFPEAQYTVTFNDDRISVRRPSGDTSSIAWSDLDEVIIETTDTGPATCDYFLHLCGAEASFTVPLGAQGLPALYERLRQLPGFQEEVAGRATPSTERAIFRCWKRSAA